MTIMRNRFLLASLLAIACAGPAVADVRISFRTTKNMNCSSGVCAPTANDAVLNVNDLENLLALANLRIVTTNGSIQANNIDVRAAFTWGAATTLKLDAYQSIIFSAPVKQSATGGGVALVNNDGGSGGVLSFVGSGKLDEAGPLTIDGQPYLLVPTLPQLVAGIARKPRGHFALQADYDASADGIYYTSPVPVAFSGSFNGLGHTISNLTVLDSSDVAVGLFSHITTLGSIASINLGNVAITTDLYGGAYAGALAGENDGTISNSSATGVVRGQVAGGLVGFNYINGVTTSSSGVRARGGGWSGGLVGENDGAISASYATKKATGGASGGLVGQNDSGGTIQNCYARGDVHAKNYVGGFVGQNEGTIVASYASAKINGSTSRGAFSGADQGTISGSYWNIDRGGDKGSGDGNETGLTGLTSEQLRSGLPDGFDPDIWVEKKEINSGYPFLKINPPPRF